MPSGSPIGERGMTATDSMTLFLALRWASPVDKGWSFEHLATISQRAEAACFDALYLGVGLHDKAVGSTRLSDRSFESLTATAALAARTTSIGLVATVPTSVEHPFNVSRFLSILDFLSYGRVAWHVTDVADAPPSQEFVDVVREFWDAWDDDAVIKDRAAGIWALTDRIHPVHHVGPYFDVRGHLPVQRSPQGHPVVVCEIGSDTDFAARNADVVVTRCPDLAGSKELREEVRENATTANRDPESIKVLAELSMVTRVGEDSAADVADTMQTWCDAGACEGWVVTAAPTEASLSAICDQLIPELRHRGVSRSAYVGATLRDHLALARPLPSARGASGDIR